MLKCFLDASHFNINTSCSCIIRRRKHESQVCLLYLIYLTSLCSSPFCSCFTTPFWEPEFVKVFMTSVASGSNHVFLVTLTIYKTLINLRLCFCWDALSVLALSFCLVQSSELQNHFPEISLRGYKATYSLGPEFYFVLMIDIL